MNSYVVSVTTSGAVWVGFHQFGIMKMKYEKKDHCSIPITIYMFGLVLFGVSSFQYFINTALRRFTQKTLHNKIIHWTSFRDTTILRFSREHTGLEALTSKKKVSVHGTCVPGFLRPVW